MTAILHCTVNEDLLAYRARACLLREVDMTATRFLLDPLTCQLLMMQQVLFLGDAGPRENLQGLATLSLSGEQLMCCVCNADFTRASLGNASSECE